MIRLWMNDEGKSAVTMPESAKNFFSLFFGCKNFAFELFFRRAHVGVSGRDARLCCWIENEGKINPLFKRSATF